MGRDYGARNIGSVVHMTVDIRRAYDNLIGMLDEYTEGLYIPTNETLNWGGIKFNVRQENLSFVDVWRNEYAEDIIRAIKQNNPDAPIQDDEWALREQYRQVRRDNAETFYEALKELVIFMKGVKAMDETVYKELLNKTPNFIKKMKLTCYKQYDYLTMRGGEGIAIPFSEALEFLVENNDSD